MYRKLIEETIPLSKNQVYALTSEVLYLVAKGTKSLKFKVYKHYTFCCKA